MAGAAAAASGGDTLAWGAAYRSDCLGIDRSIIYGAHHPSSHPSHACPGHPPPPFNNQRRQVVPRAVLSTASGKDSYSERQARTGGLQLD